MLKSMNKDTKYRLSMIFLIVCFILTVIAAVVVVETVRYEYNVVNNLEEVKINGTVYKCVNRLSMFDTSKNGCKLMFLDVTINGKVSTVGCVLIGDILYVPYNSEWYEYVVSGNIL